MKVNESSVSHLYEHNHTHTLSFSLKRCYLQLSGVI